jgi:AcrR family transcriptional regulator
MESIAARTDTSKATIFYYFGSKENLYRTVLERVYTEIRKTEESLNLAKMPPLEALRCLIEETFDFDERYPDFVRLVAIENLHGAKFLQDISSLPQRRAVVEETITDILDRGRKEGIFRDDVSWMDVHMLISAQCFFRVSNRASFKAVFKHDLGEPSLRAKHKKLICDSVTRMLESRK